jgi:hypothetical protein
MGMYRTRIAATATALLLASVVAAIFVLNGSSRQAPVAALNAGSGPTPAASPIAAVSPSLVVAQQPATPLLAGFGCSASTIPPGPQPALSALVTAVRAGSHPGSDRWWSSSPRAGSGLDHAAAARDVRQLAEGR